MNPEEDGPKRTLTARVVKVLVHHRRERGMSLEPHASRCVRAGDVHELVTTDHVETASGARIDRVAFLGFAEFDPVPYDYGEIPLEPWSVPYEYRL